MLISQDRVSPVAALAVVVVLLAGCSGEPSGSDAPLRFGLSSAPVTLDPRFATDAVSSRINRLLYARLVDFDDRFAPQPSLASWREVGPRHYRFVLDASRRPFHDGTRLTAADVAATYESVLDPATGSPHRGSLSLIEHIRVLDDDTVDFLVDRVDPLFPGRLVVGIMPAERLAAGHPFERLPIGSGPFRFERWPAGGRLALRREHDAQIVEFARVQSPTVRVLKLLRGEIDMAQGDLPSELATWLEGRPTARVLRAPGTGFAYLGFNLEDPVTGDPRVRRAIAHAVDRRAIIRYLLGGTARPAGGILGPDHWAGHPGLSGVAYDRAAARRLLEEAGYGPGRPLEIVYKTSSDPFRLRLATVIQDQLAQVGVTVRLRSFDWGTFYGDVRAGRFQMFSLAWVGVKMPDIFRYTMHSAAVPPAGANRGRFADPRVDRLIEAAERSTDPARAAALYRELQAVLLDELPYVPLWFEDQIFVARDDVEGYGLTADGNFDGLLAVSRRAEGG